MSKKSPKRNPQSKKNTKRKTTGATKKKVFDSSRWTKRPAFSSGSDPLFKKIYFGLSFAILLITSILAWNSGINGDDEFQDDYSDRLTAFYTSFGSETDQLKIDEKAKDPYNKGKLYYYGGLFDTLTGLTNAAFGNTVNDRAYHNVRHLWNAIFGFFAMFFTGLLAKEMAGWRAAILSLLLIFLSPRFLGHTLMNPKDIPFALGYVMSIYFMVRYFRQLPNFNWKLALGLVGGMAIAIGTRAGGLIVPCIFGLFAGLHFLFNNGFGGLADVKKVGTYALQVVGLSVASLLVAVAFWPWAMESPVSNTLEALGAFEKFSINIRLLFEGDNVMSHSAPRHYAVKWIWLTVPLFSLLGFVGGIALLPKLWKKYQPLHLLLILFTAIFPVFYVIYKDSVVYDGWRHLIFVYPSVVVLASLFFVTLEDLFSKNKMVGYAMYGLVGLMALEPAVYIFRNAKFPYTYFSPVAGGVGGAFGDYELDYWGVSVRPAIEWMEKEGIISENMTAPITIATTFYHPAATFTRKYGDKVKVIYVRFNQRYERQWDYGIFPSRYIRGPHLRSGNWPNGRSVHVVEASGTPLLSIEKGGGAVFDGEVAFKEKDFDTAARNFQIEVEQFPKNEIAWMKMAMSYVNIGRFQEAKNAADNMLKIAPDNTSGLFYRGVANLNAGDVAAAEADLQRSVDINEDLSSSWYYLALIKQGRGDANGALQDLQKTIEKNPRFKAAYELAAQIYEDKGDSSNATRFRQAASQL